MRSVYRFWSIFLVAIILGGWIIVPGASAQGEGRATLTVIAPALNLRGGPGVTYPPVEVLTRGQEGIIIGYDASTGWWQVQLLNGATGWVSSGPAYVAISGDTSILQPTSLPVSPPAPLLPPSPTPSAGTLIFQTVTGGPIYTVNPDGTNLRYLTSGLDPALSPDGQWVAFTRWETSQDGALGNLWLINVDGTGERVLHGNLFNPRTPVWSADGTKIAISMQHGGRPKEERVCGDQRPPRGAYDIEVIREGRDVEGFCYTLPPDPHWGLRLVEVATGTHQDLPGDTYSLSPAWDPNYAGHMIYDGDFGLVNLDLYEQRTWALTEDFNDHSPVYSPDGSKIAVSYRQDDHWEVHVMNADGSGRVRLTQTSYQTLVQQQLNGEIPHSYNNTSPAWSPDGSQIAFLTDRTGQWEIWVMNADGSNQRVLIPPGMLAGIQLQYNGMDEQSLSWR